MAGNYVRQKRIGEGAFGKAWLALCKRDQSHYVIKEVNISRMNLKEKEEARKEVSLLAQMNHSNIVKYEESFEENGVLHIVMEYCNAGDLYSKINQQKGSLFTEDQVLDWFCQICLAVKHIHDRKILHRDIKSQNIFLTTDDRVKLGDFGIAKVLSGTMELARTCIGTPYYLSPEICENKPYNNKSDIWSLGCVLYELATLKHAFEAGNMKNLVLRIIRGTYPPVPSKYSYDLRNFIAQLFKRNPKERPNINAVLRKNFMSRRIDKFLSEQERASEFSHTVMHGHVAARKVPSSARGSRQSPQPMPVKRPSSAQPTPAKPSTPLAAKRSKEDSPYSRPVVTPQPRLQPVNVRLNQAAQRRLELQRKVDLERRQRELVERQREIQDKQQMENINRAREAGWKDVLSSSSEESYRIPAPFAPGGVPAATPLVPPSPRQTPSPSPKNNGGGDPYAHYHAELDRLEQDRKNRERIFDYGANKAKYMNAPVVAPGPAGVAGALGYLPQPFPAAAPGGGGVAAGIAAGQAGAVQGSEAAQRARVVREYLDRKKDAAQHRAQGVFGEGVPGIMGQDDAKNRQEMEYLEKLRKIRENNFYERRGIHDMVKNDGLGVKNALGGAAEDLENRKRKIEALKKQAEDRAKILKEQLEQKRQLAYEKEKLKNENRKREQLNGRDGKPIMSPKEPTPSDKPRQLINGPPITELMGQLRGSEQQPEVSAEMPPAEMMKGPQMTELFERLQGSEDNSVQLPNQMPIRKKKENILKRINNKYGQNEGGTEGDSGVSDSRSQWGGGEHFDFASKPLEQTASGMESTYVAGVAKGSPVVANVNTRPHVDPEQRRSGWGGPRDTLVNVLKDQPAEDDESSDVDEAVGSQCVHGKKMGGIRGWGGPRDTLVNALQGAPLQDGTYDFKQDTNRETVSKAFPDTSSHGDNSLDEGSSAEASHFGSITKQLDIPSINLPLPHISPIAVAPDLSQIVEATIEPTTVASVDQLGEGTMDHLESIMDDTVSYQDSVLEPNKKGSPQIQGQQNQPTNPRHLAKPEFCQMLGVAHKGPQEVNYQGEGRLFDRVEFLPHDNEGDEEKSSSPKMSSEELGSKDKLHEMNKNDLKVDDIGEKSPQSNSSKVATTPPKSDKEVSNSSQKELSPKPQESRGSGDKSSFSLNDKKIPASRISSDSDNSSKVATAIFKECLTTGRFDSGNTSLLRTCSMPDLSQLFATAGVKEMRVLESARGTSSHDRIPDGDEDFYDENDEDSYDEDGEEGDEDEDEDMTMLRESLQRVLNTADDDKSSCSTLTNNTDRDDASWEDDGDEDEDAGNEEEDFGEDAPLCNRNDMFHNLELEREELEKLLGIDLLMQAYNYIQNEQDDDEENMTENERSEIAVKEMLGQSKAHAYGRIVQLVIADSAFMADS